MSVPLDAVDRLRVELTNAQIALDDAAATVQELPWWLRWLLRHRTTRLRPEWFRLRAADARDVLFRTTPPAGTARRWADVPKDG